MLIIISKYYSFNIPDFSTKLKAVIENYSNFELDILINDNSFVESLKSLFVNEFTNNFSKLVEIIKKISILRMSEQQRKKIAIHMFLKKLPQKIFENHEKSRDRLYYVENVGEHFSSLLPYGKKKYRAFFAFKDIERDYDVGHDTKADLGDVMVYGNKWNFQESVKFQDWFSEDSEVMDKFKLKVFCDVESNNQNDALVEAKQRCTDALSRITYTYFTPEKQQVPRIEPYYDITEIPRIRGELGAKIPQPIVMDRKSFSYLRDLSNKSANNISLRNSLAWFAEGHYAITEYSEFLNYWLSFETILGILEKFTTKQGYTIVVFIDALAEKPKYLKMFLQQIQTSTEGLSLIPEDQKVRDLSVISVLNGVSNGDIKITTKQMLCFIEAHKDELQYIFSRLFNINYVYARRNSLVHEGETFSFELGALSRILEVYVQVMISLFKVY
jgi:hypothetical protein